MELYDRTMEELFFKAAANDKAAVTTRNQVAKKLAALGLEDYRGFEARKAHPHEEGKTIYFHVGPSYFTEGNTYEGNFWTSIQWLETCASSIDPDRDCEGCNDKECNPYKSRAAEAWEIHYLVFEVMKAKMEEAKSRFHEANQILATLPDPEKVAKIRRRLEDRLRKDPGLAIMLAQQVGIDLTE